MIYKDITGKEFNIRLWCYRLQKECDSITKDEKKDCHGHCASCTDRDEL